MARTFNKEFKNFNLEIFKNQEIYRFLVSDINSGEVFPALRVDKIDFYYNGGCIFSYKVGGFSFNCDYLKYMGEEYTSLFRNNHLNGKIVKLESFYKYLKEGVTIETFYKDLKKGVETRFSSSSSENKKMERQFLSPLYKSTFRSGQKEKDSHTKVLDIEMRFNKSNGRKCDLVLYNNLLQKLMLVEAKVVGNSELVSNTTPKVIDQIKEYTSWLTYEETIMVQYSNYIEFMNKAFNTNLNKEIKDICKNAKLIVFENEGKSLEDNYSQKLINELDVNNVLFTKSVNVDEIWESLNK
ncbi:MAG: hypothetical protein P4L59_05705 [Desulfosporosinus sp.]|nr:hypothetical protein [Desulfosporosinus sp.]